MTRMTGPDCAVMCNFINTHTHTHTHTYNRGAGGVCVGMVPRVQSKLSRALHAHRGKKLLQDLHTLESAGMKRAMVMIQGSA